MSYFPSDIPFMSEKERKENGIRIPRDRFATDVYIYSLDLNVESPSVKRACGIIDTDDCYNPVKIAVGPNDWDVWHSEFDVRMLGVVYEPLDNVVELIIKRDNTTSEEALMLIQNYCCKKAAGFRKKLDMLNRGIGAATEAYVRDGWNV